MLKRIEKWIYLFLNFGKIKLGKKYVKEEKVALLDPTICTDNLGDYIIMEHCVSTISEIFDNANQHHIPTHVVPEKQDIILLEKSKYKIICGTNILFGEIENEGIWKIPKIFKAYEGCILMGVGWGYYSTKVSLYTRVFYHMVLNDKMLHSVRDKYTMEMLQKIGINNVIYTGCPTMWKLTPEFCEKIPQRKGKYVVTTLTSYAKDKEKDLFMLNVLCVNYDKVYFWPQGEGDKIYLKKILDNKLENISILNDGIEEYEKILESPLIDYVGTRLHAGIKAINAGKRSIIVAIDNRAKEIGKDTQLPVIEREQLNKNLESMIRSVFATKINMPWENIEAWKRSLKSTIFN